MNKVKTASSARKASLPQATARCLCGAVELSAGFPVFWAWHDHSRASRKAHGAAYATYVGVWKSRFRVTKGEKFVTRYEDSEAGRVRSFCSRCGSPLTYERAHSPKMINIPRALFDGRTGREPLYHIAIEEMQEWTYTGDPLKPLKGYPGVVWSRRKSKRKGELESELPI